jgi:hypothetical protein
MLAVTPLQPQWGAFGIMVEDRAKKIIKILPLPNKRTNLQAAISLPPLR